MILTLALTLQVVSLAQVAPTKNASQVQTGKVFRSGTSELLFTYERKQQGDVVTQIYRQPDGLPASTEIVTLSQGPGKGPSEGMIKSYTFEDHRLGERGAVHVDRPEGSDGKKPIARFVYHRRQENNPQERVDADTEILHHEIAAGPTMLQPVLDHFDEVITGAEFGIRLAVLDRQETVGFKFNFDSRFEENGRSIIRIRCTAQSFIIRLIAPKILFDFDAKTRKLIRVKGPTLLKVKDGSSWRQLEADTVVD